ncbi:MAG: metallophosphoesterase [Methanolinea sp.]|nr:metallophosphoesterase [Methanolinea sp.]
MRLKFLETGPALLVCRTMKVLVVADLHIGIESDLARHGLHFPSRSRDRVKRILACVEDADPDILVLLGDVKHMVPLTTRQEYRELPGILGELRKVLPLRVLPGNHDSGIVRFLREDELLAREGALIDGTGYLHGHTYPDPCLAGHLLVSGHHHPMVTLKDEVGCSLRAPAYLLAKVDEQCLRMNSSGEKGSRQTRVLFMPALNELAGYDIGRTVREPFSPLSRCMQTDDSEIFLADGTFIGPVATLEDHGDDQEP